MSSNPETILAKILRSSQCIKQVLICDKVGLVISKVLRIKPIEGIGALESSIFRAAEDVCEFLSLGKSVIHLSVFSDKTVVGIDIGLGYLVLVVEHKESWLLDSKVINACLNELINLWVSELGLQGYDFSVVNGVSRIMNSIYSGKRSPAHAFESKGGDIIQDIIMINNPLLLANCITNELGLPIAFTASKSINIGAEEFGGTLLSLDAVAKEKGENLALGSPVLSAVFTDQNKGVFICHAGVLEGVEPLVFQSLFDLKGGFIPILTEIYNMIIAISKEYGDEKVRDFIETVDNFIGKIFPAEEKAPIPIGVQDEQRLKLVLTEMGKNIEESITYYMNMIGDLMELISSRALEIRKSIESYDKDFKKWLDENLGGAHPKIEGELKKWEDAKNLIDAKLKQLTEQ
jgi:predicted regulator of Ras-like GTPase activity (Roadblock/LC7/MglB family)